MKAKDNQALLSSKKIKPASQEDIQSLIDLIVDAIADKKGESIISIDLSENEDAVTDAFIICDAVASTQVKAIADNVVERAKKELKEIPFHVEGMQNLEWVLIDYINVVVHVFQKNRREFYQLEELWSDAKVIHYETEV